MLEIRKACRRNSPRGCPRRPAVIRSRSASRKGRARRSEQFVTHGGHLALSALAGLTDATVVDEQADGAASGAAFGIAFLVAAYGIAGPAIGVTPLPWREQPLRAVQHPLVHTISGLAAAYGARAAWRR